MLKSLDKTGWRRGTAMATALCLLTPLAVLPAQAQIFGRRPAPAPAQGMSTKKKVVLLAGAALLYYLYKKHTTAQSVQAVPNTPVGRPGMSGTPAARRAQLYRSKNGGIYYRDAAGKPVWLTVPNRPVEVPVGDVQRYAPDYARYRGPAPAAPQGYRTQTFSDFDPSMASAFGGNGGSGGSVPPSGLPGPRGPR